MTNELSSLAGQLNRVNSALSTLGVDLRSLETTAAAFQLIGGTSQIIKGIIAAKTALTAIKAAEGAAHLAKYTIGAGAVAALATAGGVAMGMMIEKAISTQDDGQGIRGLIGGYTNGRN